MARDTEKKPPTSVQGEPQTLEEDVRRRAYELYEERGREDGHEVEDWLRAEEEVARKRGRTVAA